MSGGRTAGASGVRGDDVISEAAQRSERGGYMIIAIICLVVSFIPAVLLYVYLRNLRRDDSGYRLNCRRLLTRGILCSFAVALLAFLVSIAWGISGLGKSSPLLKAAFRAVIIAACIEEFVKYRTANKVIKKNNDKVSWLDCITFVAIVGIGSQLIEDVKNNM